MVTSQGIVQTLPQAVVVQMGIDVLTLCVQLDQLILTRLHLQQGDPHAIEDTSHHIFMPATRLDHHLRLHTGKITGRDTHTVALQQAVAVRYVHRKLVGIRFRHPT